MISSADNRRLKITQSHAVLSLMGHMGFVKGKTLLGHEFKAMHLGKLFSDFRYLNFVVLRNFLRTYEVRFNFLYNRTQNASLCS